MLLLLGCVLCTGLTACTTAPPPSTGVQAPKAAAEPATPVAEPATPAAQPQSQPPSQPQAASGTQRQEAPYVSPELKAKVAAFVSAQGLSSDPLAVVDLTTFERPVGYTKMLLAISRTDLVLVGVDNAGALKLKGQATGEFNPAKLWVFSDRTSVLVNSQAPFSAAMTSVTLQWDGAQLTVTGKGGGDPTRAFYDKREQLIKQGDLAAIRQSDEPQLYPDRYTGYHSQPKEILRLAYQEALKRYRAGDLKGALSDLEFGVKKYTEVYGPLLSPPGKLPMGAQPEYLLPLEEQVPIANDYAFFLAEAGNDKAARPLLEQVIKADPQRAVTYLNLADVLWNLGDKAGARQNYQLYLDRLGAKRDVAPARVFDRLK